MKALLSEDLAMRASAAAALRGHRNGIRRHRRDRLQRCQVVTRSFADEYARRKHLSSKTILEANMPTSVHQLLMAVANPKRKDQMHRHRQSSKAESCGLRESAGSIRDKRPVGIGALSKHFIPPPPMGRREARARIDWIWTTSSPAGPDS